LINIPGTLGDLLDVLLLLDVPTFPGCAVKLRIIAVINGSQSNPCGKEEA